MHQRPAPVLLGEAVAVRDEGTSPTQLELRLAAKEFDAQILREERPAPAIVVAPTNVMGTPRARTSCSLATVAKCLRGMTLGYSNQKSKRSPVRMR